MSICAPCTALKTISLCTDSLVIGTVPLANTPYVVYFKNLATGAIYSYHITSDASGDITLQFIDGFPLADGLLYEMWANVSGSPIEDKVNITIGAETHTCYNLKGNNVFDAYYSVNENYSSQTLAIAT